ncbi:hypothetical protein [Bradyrhizobium sp. CB1015]|uniref:hypothetical protein n=1 Tax=Bradyrhizobium sp. CB1015 TaxID=2976822 RepID=UPI0021AA9352|nr:hypothetical protein [Bradyrhizobium sp. CB1015]UWU95137.1 hypothetical protein N2604_15315 [Bradyrhizobium sp. CB1015]
MLRAFLLATAILTSLWSQANAGDCAPKQEAHFWELDDASNGNDFNPEVPDSVRDPTQFPLLLTESCGRQVSIAQAFRRGPIRVPLGSGRHLNYLPIFLQDKTSWSCQRIKPRIACVTDSQADGSGGRILTLRSEMADPNRIMPAAQLRIDSNGRVVTINDYFTLIPLQMQVGDTVYDVRDRIQRAMDNVRCSGDCKSFKGWAADRRIVEIVRYARLSKLPRSEVKKDVALFMDKVGELNKHAQALQALIGANENPWTFPTRPPSFPHSR